MSQIALVANSLCAVRRLTLAGLLHSLGFISEEVPLALTRVFKSGNSQAVRIPADLACADRTQELNITRHGDVITICPARQSLKDAVALLRAIPKPGKGYAREPIKFPDRAWD